MADFQEQLNAILGDPQAMAQISQLARSLSGPSPAETEEAQEEVPAGDAPDLSALAGGLDPKMVQSLLHLYGEYRHTDEKKAALLAALSPYLKEERRATLERAQQAARLAHVIRSAIDLWKGEGGHV